MSRKRTQVVPAAAGRAAEALQAFDRMVEAVRAFAAIAYPCSPTVLVVLDAGPWHADVVLQVVGDRYRAEGLVSLENVGYVDCTDRRPGGTP